LNNIGKVITVDSAKNLVNEYSSKAGSLAAHLTTLVQEAGKIFSALPLEVNKFGANKDKDATQASNIIYSSSEKSYI
jgi:hypothetical protein